MVNDLHRLGPGSVGVGGGGEKEEGAKRDEQQTNIDERSEPSGGMEPPRIPVRLTDIFFGATPPVIIYVGERRCRTTLPVHKHS